MRTDESGDKYEGTRETDAIIYVSKLKIAFTVG